MEKIQDKGNMTKLSNIKHIPGPTLQEQADKDYIL